ncbi:uncharacterized protein LOC112128058 [Cimex lectularius]|uniref:Nucleic-acid-binding protein from transposon X-element n=1 Tax=Cimex lectularius TaxID=79782 RepID=A0A8I6TL49_CIMLE|nr:uncharacterized protein LOC112128058 [Cimex lectularius]
MTESSGGKDPPDIPPDIFLNVNNENTMDFTESQKHSLKRAAEDGPLGYNKIFLASNENVSKNKKLDRNSLLSTLALNRYKLEDKGPYVVFIESSDAHVGKMHPMKLGKLIHNSSFEHREEISNMFSSGINRIKVEFKTQTAANAFVNSGIIKDKNLSAYIPSYFIFKMGVIRGVDPDMSEEEILKVIKSPVRVKSVRRIKKTITENNRTRIINLGTCILTFDSQQLPETVTIYGTRCRVDAYIPPLRQCRKCFRFNHFQDQCKGKQKCETCGLAHDDNTPCSNVARCVNCSGNHKASDRNCPEYNRIMEIKRKKVVSSTLYSTVTSNKYNLLANLSDFPNLDSPNVKDQSKKNKHTVKHFSSYRHSPYNIKQKGSGFNKNDSDSQIEPNTTTAFQEKVIDPTGRKFAGPKANPYSFDKDDASYYVQLLQQSLHAIETDSNIEKDDIFSKILLAYQQLIKNLRLSNSPALLENAELIPPNKI